MLRVAAVLLTFRSLAAQCPDGSPPPCGRSVRPAPPAANSVAALYFDARDTADAYLADGLTEDLTSLLGSVPSVQVKSPGVVRRAQRAAPGDAPAIAHWAGRTDNSFVAAALVAVGDTAEALHRLELLSPSPDVWAALHRPEFDALHGHPRYEQLLAAVRPPGAVGP